MEAKEVMEVLNLLNHRNHHHLRHFIYNDAKFMLISQSDFYSSK